MLGISLCAKDDRQLSVPYNIPLDTVSETSNAVSSPFSNFVLFRGWPASQQRPLNPEKPCSHEH